MAARTLYSSLLIIIHLFFKTNPFLQPYMVFVFLLFSLLRNTFSSFPVLFPTSNPIFPQHSAQFPSTKKPSHPTPGHSDLLSSEFLYHLYIYTIQSTILLTLFYIILQLLNGYFFFSQPYKFFCILHSD